MFNDAKAAERLSRAVATPPTPRAPRGRDARPARGSAAAEARPGRSVKRQQERGAKIYGQSRNGLGIEITHACRALVRRGERGAGREVRASRVRGRDGDLAAAAWRALCPVPRRLKHGNGTGATGLDQTRPESKTWKSSRKDWSSLKALDARTTHFPGQRGQNKIFAQIQDPRVGPLRLV